MKVMLLALLLVTGLMVNADVLFEDDFSDGNADGWLQWTSGYGANAQYNVVEEEYVLSNSGTGWLPAAAHNGDQNGTMSTADYSIVAQITPVNCFRAGILARGYVPSFTGYLCIIIPSQNIFGISRLTSSGPQSIATINMPLYHNQTYWVRFQVEGTSLSGRIWQGTLENEPTDWQLSCSNSQYTTPGRIGAFCCNFGTDEKALLNVRFDNITVSAITTNLDSTTWASIKSSSI